MDRRNVGGRARDTGTATAATGGYANTGVHHGDVHLIAPPPARSAYRRQVARIAPPRLLGRDAELAELAAFCTGDDPGHPAYTWWQAPAWAGKSALLAWFVLHPPPGVRVVSFFITARWAGQSDRAAFLDVVAEQLAELTGRPVPTVSEATREAHWLDLLEAAAENCRARGERLLLVVDGLDEDRGVTVGPDAHSIAAMLPPRPTAGMRVVLTGRPDPPLSADVMDDHPLRDPGIVRRLAASPHAQAVRADAERELKRLLHGTPDERDLLGLVTASGGGLTVQDLAELTDWTEPRIAEQLHAVSGRTFARRAGPCATSRDEVYVLAHEELQASATRLLGRERLETYRQRLHNWAGRYREQGWPDDTPHYLLHGYFAVLHAIGDVQRMIACVTDRARHDRMLSATATDNAALTEVTAVQQILRDRTPPDLAALWRLALARGRLHDRNPFALTRLPVVWYLLGNPARAEALAHSVPGAMNGLVRGMAESGDLDRAETLIRAVTETFERNTALLTLAREASKVDPDRTAAYARAMIGDDDSMMRLAALMWVVDARARAGDLAQAEALARTIANHEDRATAMARLAHGAIARGELLRAEAVADSLTGYPEERFHVLDHLAENAATSGDLDRARALTDQAEALIPSFPREDGRIDALCLAARAAARNGDPRRARVLTDQAAEIARRCIAAEPYGAYRINPLAKAGRLDVAETLARGLANDSLRAEALAAAACAGAEHDDAEGARPLIDRAETLARGLAERQEQAMALADVAEAAARSGDPGRARVLAEDAETIARADTDPGEDALITVLDEATGTADPDRVAALASSLSGYPNEDGLAALAVAIARGGGLEQAETLVRGIHDTERCLRAFAALAAAGDEDRARALAGQVESLADQAEGEALSATEPGWRADGLAIVAQTVAQIGDVDRARRLADRAVDLLRTLVDPDDYRHARLAPVMLRAWAGDLEGAEALARSQRATEDQALGIVAQAMARAGHVDRAEALALTLYPAYRAETVAALAEIVDPSRARRLLAWLLCEKEWRTALHALAQVEPTALTPATGGS